jgi:hypothetical protein
MAPLMHRLQALAARYPEQFWLMFCGMFLSAVGASMIWPFLMLYVSEKLQVLLRRRRAVTLNANRRALVF